MSRYGRYVNEVVMPSVAGANDFYRKNKFVVDSVGRVLYDQVYKRKKNDEDNRGGPKKIQKVRPQLSIKTDRATLFPEKTKNGLSY